MLAKEDRKDLVWAMRTSLLESVRSGILTEGKKAAAENFIINEATYEQLLNLAFNPERDTNYKSTQVLEKVALESYNSILESAQTEEVTTEEVVEESVFAKLEKSVQVQEGVMAKAKTMYNKMSEKAKEKAGSFTKWYKELPKSKKVALIGGAAAGAGAAAVGTAKYLKHRREKKAAK